MAQREEDYKLVEQKNQRNTKHVVKTVIQGLKKMKGITIYGSTVTSLTHTPSKNPVC